MALKIYLSPSSQEHNEYSAGNTVEQRQCNRIAEAAKVALERNGYINSANSKLTLEKGKKYIKRRMR